MPFLKIQTNQPILTDNKASLLSAASRLVSKELSKPEAYVMVLLEDSTSLIFAGTMEPAAFVEMKSIGLPETALKKLSDSLSSFLEKELGVPPGRTFIEFSNAQGKYWGWNGDTFG